MMDIFKLHPDYINHYEQWTRCLDAYAGSDRIKSKTVDYLPKLSSKQTEQEYKDYLKGALWYPAYSRTVNGMCGLCFYKDIEFVLPENIDNIINDIDLMGTTLSSFIVNALKQTLITSRYGVLVDMPHTDSEITMLYAQDNNIRPFLVGYNTLDIINWSYKKIKNKYGLSRLVLREYEYSETAMEYNVIYKELRLEEVSENNNIYIVSTYKKDNKGEFVLSEEPKVPLFNNAPLNFIPFWIVDPVSGGIDIIKPVLLDLVDVNISHYNTMANLEHARFFLGVPTPILIGFNDDESNILSLGAKSGIRTSNSDASVQYLEFNGKGLEELRFARQEKEDMMVNIGSKLLAQDKKGVETAEALKIRAYDESANLASIANSVSRSFTDILNFLLLWNGSSGEVSVHINTEYFPENVSPEFLSSVIQAYQLDAIPKYDYFRFLKRADIVEKNRDYNDFAIEMGWV